MAGTMSVEEAIAEQSDEPTEEEKKKAENEAFWANLKEQASEKSKKEAQAKHQQAKDESPSGDPFADALVRLSKQAGNKALIDQYVAEQGVVPYSQHVEMDPAYAQSLKGMEQYLSGEYEERLRREGAAQIMQGQQLQSQIGQTTQAMGSRGMGRVAQLGAASKTDMMAQLQMNIDQAARDAFQAQKEASVEMRNIMMANLEQQKALHGWEDDDITLAQNQADGWIQAQQNLMSLMITEGRLETAEQWEAFGMWSGKAYQEWLAAETPEEKEKVKAKYFSEGAGWDLEATGDSPYTVMSDPVTKQPRYYKKMDDGSVVEVSEEEYNANLRGGT